LATAGVLTPSLIGIKGKAMAIKGFNQIPPLNNRELFRRDRHLCAYCGDEFNFYPANPESASPNPPD
jgi:hypothetical protein